VHSRIDRRGNPGRREPVDSATEMNAAAGACLKRLAEVQGFGRQSTTIPPL